ncbi:MAG: GHMP family kinase ATP-binding protein [Candidatus Aminicenantales bacterium]
MIITRTPFRIPLGGGGTDLPAYYSQYGGFILAAAINKYMYINLNRPIVDNLVRVKYSLSETVSHRDELKHEIAREALRMMGIEDSIEIVSMADVPAGTGLGSSSCYAVGLLNGLHSLRRSYVTLHELAEEACELEINRLKKPIGKQDQYMAVFGGIRVMEIDREGKVSIRLVSIDNSVMDELNHNLLLFYSGIKRPAENILASQSAKAREGKGEVIESLHHIKELGQKALEAIKSGNLTELGLSFSRHWEYKKRMSPDISSPWFDAIIEEARKNGAVGGKIIGAGGGGFFLFYVEEKHKKLRQAMARLGLREMRYHFDWEGSKILVNLINDVR